VQRVVGSLLEHAERAVLGEVPAAGVAARLKVERELVAAARRQPTEQFVAEPVVAARVVETDPELGPRTVEDERTVNVALDQQRNAVRCRTEHPFIVHKSV